jgi:phosphoglycerate dehydrogenase-like enzyme
LFGKSTGWEDINSFEKLYKLFISDQFKFKKDREKIIEDFEMLVINSKIQVNKNFIDKATKLKVVGRLGSGKEIINLEYAIHRDIVFHNSPEGNRDAVAEHCLGLILGLLNFIPRSFEEIKKHQWNREINRGNELSSKTVGIIGYGHTGKETAKRLSVFTSKILVYEKYEKGFSNDVVQEVEMEEIYTHADIISLHLPLTNETSQSIYAGLTAQNPYMSSDGYVCFKAYTDYPGDISFTFNVTQANPTGTAAVSITAASQNSTSGNYY